MIEYTPPPIPVAAPIEIEFEIDGFNYTPSEIEGQIIKGNYIVKKNTLFLLTPNGSEKVRFVDHPLFKHLASYFPPDFKQ